MAPFANADGRIYGPERIHQLAAIVRWHRSWHMREQDRYPLHPAVLSACTLANPRDWHELVLQWPHKAEKEPTRLAYTQDEKKAVADRQTVTTIGKYLTRHFDLPDHVIRGIAHRFSVEGVFIWKTTEEIVRACREGPYSCMQWADEEGQHPYEVYAPEFGWAIAVRIEGGQINGRALILDDGESKCFVRSYARPANASHYSERDDALEAFLEGEGFKHRRSWPEGTKLARVPYEGDRRYYGGDLLPYIDGGTQTVSSYGSHYVIDSDGDWECTSTDGTAEEAEREVCSCCGERHRDTDGGIWVGRHDDEWVGPCCSDDYVYARGRRGNEYYIPRNDAVEVDGDYFDPDYLSENDIVELDNGDYCKLDNAFNCPILDAWFHCDDGVYTEDEGTVHEDEAWTCAVSGNVYSSNTDHVENAAGEKVHPDYFEEETEESPDTETP
jgi:hypothetical protein